MCILWDTNHTTNLVQVRLTVILIVRVMNGVEVGGTVILARVGYLG